jgi:hypothetical protein
MLTLQRSTDRKTANLSTPNGKQAKIKNAFGLPSGRAFSCPGQTSVCEKVCYAGKLEKLFPGFRNVMTNNWEAVKNATVTELFRSLHAMIGEFRDDCVKYSAPREFRIHHDGDFFSATYAMAWAAVCRANPDVTFWVYTRSFTPGHNYVPYIVGIPNLTVYLSVDDDNRTWAEIVKAEYAELHIAYLAQTADIAKDAMLELTGRPGAACPEVIGRIPLITNDGGACHSCQLCVVGKADIRFSISKG